MPRRDTMRQREKQALQSAEEMIRGNWHHFSAKKKIRDALLTASLGDTVFAAQAVEDDVDLLYSQILRVVGPPDLASKLL
jgi:hypothetical protein